MITIAIAMIVGSIGREEYRHVVVRPFHDLA